MKVRTWSLAPALLVAGMIGRAEGGQGAGAAQVPVVKEKVEVVTSKLPVAPHDVPVSVEVIDGQTLLDIGAVTLRDALSLAAGIEIGPGGDAGPAGAVPEFWGLREFDAFLLVVDNVPLGGAFNPDLVSLNLRDVERIEILRGAAPVTFGATSFVGVIHVVHKAGSERMNYGSVRGGAFGSGGAAGDFALPSFGGWQSRLSVDGERQGFKDDRTGFGRVRAMFRAAKTEGDVRSWFSADMNWTTQDPASPHARQGTALSVLTPLDANYNPSGAYLDSSRFNASFGTERPMGNGATWTLLGSYSHQGQEMFRGFLTEIDNIPDNATGFVEQIEVNDLYADFHVTWPTGERARVLAGGDFQFGNGEGRGAAFTYTAPLDGMTAVPVMKPSVLDLDSEARRNFAGAYVAAEFTPTARVNISAGVRLNVTNERRGEGESTGHVRPGGNVGLLVSLWERDADHLKVFANYRDTFKPAAFDFSLAENEGVLDPETARSYEGGLKLRLASGRVDLEASGFRMDFTNLVTSTVVNGLPSLQNAGETRFQGFEVASDLRLPHAILARGTYSFHDGKFVDFVQSFGSVNTQLAGKRFEMSARHLASGGLIYAPASGLVGSLILKYTGDRFMDKRNRALTPGFATVDASVGFRRDRWEIRVTGTNLGDARDPISESEVGDAQYYRMPARRFDAAFSIRF